MVYDSQEILLSTSYKTQDNEADGAVNKTATMFSTADSALFKVRKGTRLHTSHRHMYTSKEGHPFSSHSLIILRHSLTNRQIISPTNITLSLSFQTIECRGITTNFIDQP